MLDTISDDECAICGKERSQHSTASGYGMCQIYPLFESKRAMTRRIAKAALESMSSEDEVRDKLERRRAIYLKKRNLFNALAESTETPWERYDFAAEVVEWVAGDLGIKLSERDDEALTPNPCGQGDGGALVSGD